MDDPGWAAAKLTEFIAAIDEHGDRMEQEGARRWDPGYRDLDARIYRLRGVAERIIDAVAPDLIELLHEDVDEDWMWGKGREIALATLGIIEHQDDLKRALGPLGPSLGAQGLHPWVWEPAARLWDGEHYRAALRAATSAVFDDWLPEKIERPDLSGTTAVEQAFSLQPPAAGRCRLRRPGFIDSTPAWKDAHQGALHLGQGCALAIRNLVTHGEAAGELEAQPALEEV